MAERDPDRTGEPADVPLSVLASEVRTSLARVGRRLRAERGDADLPEGQYGILVMLSKHGPMTPGAMAERERVRPPSVTRGVNMLAALGLVERSDHPTDGRQVVVSLTEAGRAEILETRRRRDVWLTAQLEGLDSAEREVLAQAQAILARIAEC